MRGGVSMAAAWGLFLRATVASDERDVCSDAFGEDAERATCVPSTTLCCIRRSQSFPSCQQYLGKGWCCVGENEKDSCYVDQKSACRDENAVECAKLKVGTDRACCPRFTTCDPNTEASEDYVRCNINQGDLKSFHSASIASSATTTTTLSTGEGSSEPKTTSSTTSRSSEPTTDGEKAVDGNEGLSGGAIAGIAVGGVAGLSLVGLAVWFLFRKKKQRSEYQAAQQDPRLPVPQFYENQQMKQQYGTYQGQYEPAHAGQQFTDNGYHSGYNSPPLSELPVHSHQPVEMDGGGQPPR